MNLTDRIYLWIHVALSVLVLVCHDRVSHWPRYIAWNIAAIAAILVVSGAARVRQGSVWQFAHDWLPGAVFFTSVFEEISFLSLALVPHWQSGQIAAFELAHFGVSPEAWLHAHVSAWLSELFAFGYLCFYPMYPIVGLTYWFWRNRPGYGMAFRRMTDALAVGYLVCYSVYLFWPTQSPNHTNGIAVTSFTGPFHALIRFVQGSAGVHGNAFPSSHIMLSFVVLVFVWRYFPRSGPWLLAINILMCLGAVYDGYHWASDAVAGAVVGSAVGLVFVRKLTRDELSLP